MSPLQSSNMSSNLELEIRGIDDWRLLSPDMIFYEANFIALLLAVGFLFYRQREEENNVAKKQNSPAQELVRDEDRKAVSKFSRQFLIVYALVMGGDWLQGAHIYAIYKDQYGFPEEAVARFFAAGFLSGGVSAYFVGRLADKFGRRFMCCVFCVTYSLSCLSTLFPTEAYIYAGRILGGLSTSILYSAFESWMITEFHKRRLEKVGSLSQLLGTMTTVNSLVGIASGVISEALVKQFNTRVAPFMGSVFCFVCAFIYMISTWTENYGDNKVTKRNTSESSSESTPLLERKSSALKTIFTDKRVLSLGITTCFFEGSMYLFVFFWGPSLQATLPVESHITETRSLPYGLIFSTFMTSMMLGSLIFNHAMSIRAIQHSMLLFVVLIAAAGTFLVDVFFSIEWVVFWGLCVFEICVGIYYPTMGYLKGKIVDDSCRSAVYATLRVPLNAFVVSTLAFTKEGDGHRNLVFTICCALLMISAIVVQRTIRA